MHIEVPKMHQELAMMNMVYSLLTTVPQDRRRAVLMWNLDRLDADEMEAKRALYDGHQAHQERVGGSLPAYQESAGTTIGRPLTDFVRNLPAEKEHEFHPERDAEPALNVISG